MFNDLDLGIIELIERLQASDVIIEGEIGIVASSSHAHILKKHCLRILTAHVWKLRTWIDVLK